MNEPTLSVTAPIAPVVTPVFEGMKEQQIDMVRDTWDIDRTMQWYNKSMMGMFESVVSTTVGLFELAEKDKRARYENAIELHKADLAYRKGLREPFTEKSDHTVGADPDTAYSYPSSKMVRLPNGEVVSQEKYEEMLEEERRRQSIKNRRPYAMGTGWMVPNE